LRLALESLGGIVLGLLAFGTFWPGVPICFSSLRAEIVELSYSFITSAPKTLPILHLEYRKGSYSRKL